jgi:hypothetical protein
LPRPIAWGALNVISRAKSAHFVLAVIYRSNFTGVRQERFILQIDLLEKTHPKSSVFTHFAKRTYSEKILIKSRRLSSVSVTQSIDVLINNHEQIVWIFTLLYLRNNRSVLFWVTVINVDAVWVSQRGHVLYTSSQFNITIMHHVIRTTMATSVSMMERRGHQMYATGKT